MMLFTVIKFILVVVEVLCSFLLIGVILIQKPKSQGMGLAFGAGMGETLFGTQVGNVLTKITVVLSAIFLINTTVLAFMGTTKKGSSVVDKVLPASNLPAAPGGGIPASVPSDGVGGPAAVPAPEGVTPLRVPESGQMPETPAAPIPSAGTVGGGAVAPVPEVTIPAAKTEKTPETQKPEPAAP